MIARIRYECDNCKHPVTSSLEKAQFFCPKCLKTTWFTVADNVGISKAKLDLLRKLKQKLRGGCTRLVWKNILKPVLDELEAELKRGAEDVEQ